MNPHPRLPALVRLSALALLLAALGAPAARAAFPGANGRIAFRSLRDGNWEIYTMLPDGGDPTNLTRHPADDRGPAWSPDGARLAFRSDRAGSVDLYVMDADGDNLTQLTSAGSDEFAIGWSPDGTRFVYSSDQDGDWEIYVANLDGSGVTQLTFNRAYDRTAAWSPDGTRIVFVSNRDGNHEIYVMDAGGGNQTRLTNHPAGDRAPAWSPDSARVAWRSDRDGDNEIYTMPATGGGATQLTHNTAADIGPAWSPDGTMIAFTSDRDGNLEIYRMGADGSNQTNLTRSPAAEEAADWQPAPQEPPAAEWLLSATGPGVTPGGLSFAATDVLALDQNAGAWSLYFQGADVGLTKPIGAFALAAGGDLLLSLSAPQTVPGVGPVKPHDVLRFTPTALGATTAGAFSRVLTGANAGLTTVNERIDALEQLPDGRLLISTVGAARLPGVSGELRVADEDAAMYDPATGRWSPGFDGTAVPGLGGEDVRGLAVGPGGEVYVLINGRFRLGTVTGDGRSIVRLSPDTAAPGGYRAEVIYQATPAGFPANFNSLALPWVSGSVGQWSVVSGQ